MPKRAASTIQASHGFSKSSCISRSLGDALRVSTGKLETSLPILILIEGVFLPAKQVGKPGLLGPAGTASAVHAGLNHAGEKLISAMGRVENHAVSAGRSRGWRADT